jgi:hypothetical protein
MKVSTGFNNITGFETYGGGGGREGVVIRNGIVLYHSYTLVSYLGIKKLLHFGLFIFHAKE